MDGPLAMTSEVLGLKLRFEENRLRLWDPVEGAYLLEPHKQAARPTEAAARRAAVAAQRVAEAQARQESQERTPELEAQIVALKA